MSNSQISQIQYRPSLLEGLMKARQNALGCQSQKGWGWGMYVLAIIFAIGTIVAMNDPADLMQKLSDLTQRISEWSGVGCIVIFAAVGLYKIHRGTVVVEAHETEKYKKFLCDENLVENCPSENIIRQLLPQKEAESVIQLFREQEQLERAINKRDAAGILSLIDHEVVMSEAQIARLTEIFREAPCGEICEHLTPQNVRTVVLKGIMTKRQIVENLNRNDIKNSGTGSLGLHKKLLNEGGVIVGIEDCFDLRNSPEMMEHLKAVRGCAGIERARDIRGVLKLIDERGEDFDNSLSVQKITECVQLASKKDVCENLTIKNIEFLIEHVIMSEQEVVEMLNQHVVAYDLAKLDEDLRNKLRRSQDQRVIVGVTGLFSLAADGDALEGVSASRAHAGLMNILFNRTPPAPT